MLVTIYFIKQVVAVTKTGDAKLITNQQTKKVKRIINRLVKEPFPHIKS
jgi:hypothetical protein